MTALLRLFISFLPVFLFSFSFQSDINVYSDKLYLDLFNHKWKNIPSNESLNRAFDYSNIKFSFDKEDYTFGIGYLSEGVVEVNKGFIQTWYYASSDFNTLLKKSDIGYYITEPKIYGIENYSQFQSVFVGKKFKYFKINFSLLRGKVLQYMKVNGFNRKKHFITDLDYYYSDKNILMDNYLKSKNYKGIGYSFDIKFFRKFHSYEIGAGFFNIFGAIKWRNIILMKYHFDSNTKYIGNDGYYHYRPFGVGKFIKTSFYQKLPFYVKYHIKKYLKNFSFGDEGIYSVGARYDELFIRKNLFKIGYVPQSKSMVFGLYFKNLNVELSNNIKYHTKFLKLFFKINY